MSTGGTRYHVIALTGLLWHVVIMQGLGSLLIYLLNVEMQNIKWTVKKRMLFKTYVASFFHSTILTILAITLYIEMRNYSDEKKLFGFTHLCQLSCEIFLGYLIQDALYLILYDKILNSREAIVHHLSYIAIASYTLPNSYFIFPYMWLTLGEASTPFLAIRWFLSAFDLKDSIIYKVNGVLFALLFFITRIVIYFIGLYHLFITLNIWFDRAYGLRLVYFGLICLFFLNIFWFYKIFKGALRTLRQKTPSKQKVKSS